MEIKEKSSAKDSAYKAYVKKKLRTLMPVFLKASIGDFSKNVNLPDEEDEFSELYIGVQIMLDVIREKLRQQEEWNNQLEERIREKTKALEEAQQIAHLGNWEWDLKSGKIWWSDELYRIHGFKPGSISIDLKKTEEWVVPEDSLRIREVIKRNFEEARKVFGKGRREYITPAMEYRIKLPSGEKKILRGQGKIIPGASGIPERFMGTVQDISDLKQVENSLAEAQQLAHIGNWEWDMPGNKIHWSNELYRIYGLKPQSAEITDKVFFRHIHSDDRKLVRTVLKLACKTRQPFNFFYKIKRTNGAVRILHCRGSVMSDEKNRVKKIIGTSQDVTELRLADEALQEANIKLEHRVKQRTTALQKAVDVMRKEVKERKNAQKELKYEKEKLQKYLRIAGVIFLVVGKDQQVEMINRKGCEVLGLKEASIVGKKWFDHYVPRHARRETKRIFRRLMSGMAESAEYDSPVVNKKGEERIISWQNIVIRDDHGNIQGTLSSGEDITDYLLSLEKQKELVAIVESTEDAVVGKTLRGVVTSWNHGAERMYGYTEEEAIGRHISFVIPPQKREEFNRIIDRVRKGKKIRHLETQRRRKDGTLIHVSLSFSPILKGGKIIGCSAIGRNITEQKLAQEAIKETQQRLNNFMNSATDVFVLFDEKLYLVAINKSGRRLLEALHGEKKEFTGKHITELSPRLKNSERLVQFRKVVETGRSFTVEESGQNARLGRRHFTLTAFKAGKGLGVIARDITKARQFELRLAESEKKYRSLVETINDGVIGVDNNDIIQFVNRAFCKMTGYSSAELIGKRAMDILLDEEEARKKIEEAIEQRKNGEPGQYEQAIVTKKGNRIWVFVSASPVSDVTTGEITGSVAIVSNISQRKKAEEMFYLAVEAAPNSMIMIDNKGRIILTNSETEKLFGYTRSELLGKNINRLIPYRLDSRRFSTRKKFSGPEQGSPKGASGDLVGLHKNGREVPIEVRLNPIKTEEQSYMLASVIDIAERKRYETELNNLAKFPEEDPSPVMRYSVKNQEMMYVNKAAKVLVSFLEQPENGTIRKRWLKLMNETFRQGTMAKHELQAGGQLYLFTLVPIPSEEYINVYASDITRIREAEQEIKRLSFLISKTDNALIVADREGRIQWVNEGFIRLTGFSLEDVQGTHGEELHRGKPTGLNPESQFYRKMMAEKKSVSYESHNFRKDGTEYWALSTLTPILNHNGEIENIVVIDTDITTRKQTEKELLQAKKLAEESARAKQTFLANMSHEIRTPMNAIMGMAQLLQDTELNSQQKEYLSSINFAGENLLRIINDVLDISKIESGKIGFERIDFNLRDLVNDLINTMSYPAREKKIDLRVYIDEKIPETLIGDPIRLNQVLMNLISNAVKFTEQGFVLLVINVKEKENGCIRLRFQVKDTGIGIPQEKQAQIFEAFEQAHKETTRKHGGTGLGLAIVKKLIDMQGGSIGVKSRMDHGSVFFFDLSFDIGKEHILKKEDTKATDGSSLYGKKVLLVEDNKLNQMVADKFLKGWGIDVTISANGKEAVDALRHGDFDLVLMDIQMPEMDGYEATRYIRERFRNKKQQVPIIAMTAHAIGGEEEKCLSIGMNDYISKPLNRDILKDKLIQYLQTTN